MQNSGFGTIIKKQSLINNDIMFILIDFPPCSKCVCVCVCVCGGGGGGGGVVEWDFAEGDYVGEPYTDGIKMFFFSFHKTKQN